MLPTTPAPVATVKPTATATIEPMGPRDASPRDHLIKLVINMVGMKDKFADKSAVIDMARKAMEGFGPVGGQADRREFGDVSASARAGKGGTVATSVVGLEGSIVWHGRPSDEALEHLRTSLAAEGYRVAVRERRECAEKLCTNGTMIDWSRPKDVPAGWYSNALCGSHNYRTCKQCKSIFRLTATNNAGQAPAVHCEVCGLVLVEWGSSKVWAAELMTRGA